MKTLASLAWFSGACALAFAQTNSHQPAPAQGEWRMPGTESFVMRSSIVQRDYEIMVALPRIYSVSGKHPVLYVLDANGMFLTVGLLDKEVVPAVEKLDALLRTRKYQNFTWHAEYFPGETHLSAIPAGLSRGIRWLYADQAPQSSPP